MRARRRKSLRAAALAALLLLPALPACGGDDAPPAGEERVVAGPASPAESPRAAEYRRLLQEAPLAARVDAAFRLAGERRVKPAERAGLLLDALRGEVASPAASGAPAKSYLSATDWARSRYTRALAGTGPEGLEAVRRAAREEEGEVRERALLALGYAGLEEAVPGLRALLRESPSGEVRASAAWLLGDLRAGKAVPELEAALADPYEAAVERYGERITFFPVREQALGALEALGREVLESEDGTLRLAPAP